MFAIYKQTRKLCVLQYVLCNISQSIVNLRKNRKIKESIQDRIYLNLSTECHLSRRNYILSLLFAKNISIARYFINDVFNSGI